MADDDLFDGVDEEKWNEEELTDSEITLLMSKNNPEGWELGELLQTILDELQIKNDLLMKLPKKEMDYQIKRKISNNNLSIISKLRKCIHAQNDSVSLM